MKKQKGGWDVVFTDSSSKITYQQLTEGYVVWYGEADARNRSFVLSRGEDQTNNRGEFRAAYYALSHQPAGKALHMVVDSEWVYKGVTEWGEVWRRHHWRTATGDVAHGDLWEPFLDLVRERGDTFSIQWVPSHIEIMGNERADQLAEKGRVRHCAYSREWVREVQQRQSSEWQGIGSARALSLTVIVTQNSE